MKKSGKCENGILSFFSEILSCAEVIRLINVSYDVGRLFVVEMFYHSLSFVFIGFLVSFDEAILSIFGIIDL